MSNYQHIYNRLRQAGLTEAAALGFLGNWQQESGCEPNRLQNDFDPFRTASRTYTARVGSRSISRQEFGRDQKGFGLAQWTYVNEARTAGRKFDLYDFWQRSGKALDDLDMQIDFALWELHHGYSGVWADLVHCDNLLTATDIICRRFEQPANNNVETRLGYAREIQRQIKTDAWQQAEEPAAAPEKGGPVTIETAKANLVSWCNAQVGTREGANNFNKYAADPRITRLLGWDAQNQPWCDLFTDEAFIDVFGLETGAAMTYQPIGSGSALCSASAQFFQSAGAWSSVPEVGDVVFFYVSGGINHQGIVTEVSGSTITTVEGNSSDMVARRTYQIGASNIAGYGRPNWSLVASVSGSDTGSQAAAAQPAEDITVPGKTCDVTLPELRQGDTGKPVERLQTLLIGRGYYCGGRSYSGREQPDGEFGPATEVAVRDLQMAANISQDGVVGSDTWAALITK